MVNLIRRRDQLDPTATMVPVMNRLMNQLLGDPLLGDYPMGMATLEEGTLPLDISENENNIIVRASLPGYSPDDVDIQIENGVLNIRAEHNEEHEETNERFYRRERIWGSMSRRVALPSNVRGDDVDASLESGILTLRIPKSEEAKPRKVQIKGGQTQQDRKQVGVGTQSQTGQQPQRSQMPGGQGQQTQANQGRGQQNPRS